MAPATVASAMTAARGAARRLLRIPGVGSGTARSSLHDLSGGMMRICPGEAGAPASTPGAFAFAGSTLGASLTGSALAGSAALCYGTTSGASTLVAWFACSPAGAAGVTFGNFEALEGTPATSPGLSPTWLGSWLTVQISGWG